MYLGCNIQALLIRLSPSHGRATTLTVTQMGREISLRFMDFGRNNFSTLAHTFLHFMVYEQD